MVCVCGHLVMLRSLLQLRVQVLLVCCCVCLCMPIGDTACMQEEIQHIRALNVV